jgi:hypothetical protein
VDELGKSWVKATLSKGYSDRTYQRYAEVPVRAIIGDFLERMKAINASIVGTRKFFAVEVEPYSDTVKTVVACQDDTLFYGRDLKTGKALVTKPSKEDFSKITVGMTRRGEKWTAATYYAEEGAAACVR